MVESKNVKPDAVKLRNLLKEYNMSKADLINKAGLPIKTGYRIFEADASVRFANLQKLLKPLGLDADNFIKTDKNDFSKLTLTMEAIIFDEQKGRWDEPVKMYRSSLPSERYLPIEHENSIRFKIKVSQPSKDSIPKMKEFCEAFEQCCLVQAQGNYLRDFSYEEQLVSLGNRVEAADLIKELEQLGVSVFSALYTYYFVEHEYNVFKQGSDEIIGRGRAHKFVNQVVVLLTDKTDQEFWYAYVDRGTAGAPKFLSDGFVEESVNGRRLAPSPPKSSATSTGAIMDSDDDLPF